MRSESTTAVDIYQEWSHPSQQRRLVSSLHPSTLTISIYCYPGHVINNLKFRSMSRRAIFINEKWRTSADLYMPEPGVAYQGS